ncbi:hypothetical protein NEMBOFW57_001150 [Staphylotrichum longicolle]|uniref:Uncharacterized protein n=1 Tax=Staphylotrichum longicolle TaxID=669026 RepID=A0AAD4HXM5_9PEZI|nr:hypothetical protein NEMBOFW57_001150 [Staphylotrichum longicolle]
MSPFKGGSLRERIMHDEEIVNVALVVFLRSLTVECDDLRPHCMWSPGRYAFRVCDRDGNKVYEARVDGALCRRSNQGLGKWIFGIMEVKPFSRRANRTGICMQEGAQMVAWVSQQPPKDLAEARKRPDHKFCRLLISQERHEVYLTFAVFDADCVDYIRGAVGATQLPSTQGFMQMHEYGPFSTTTRSHMQGLGELVVALCYQLSRGGELRRMPSTD